MQIDFQEILSGLKSIVVSLFNDHKGELTEEGLQYAHDAEERFGLLLEGLVSGDIDNSLFIDMLKEEKDLLTEQALSLKMQGEVIADEGIQKAVAVIINSLIGTVLKIIL